MLIIIENLVINSSWSDFVFLSLIFFLFFRKVGQGSWSADVKTWGKRFNLLNPIHPSIHSLIDLHQHTQSILSFLSLFFFSFLKGAVKQIKWNPKWRCIQYLFVYFWTLLSVLEKDCTERLRWWFQFFLSDELLHHLLITLRTLFSLFWYCKTQGAEYTSGSGWWWFTVSIRLMMFYCIEEHAHTHIQYTDWYTYFYLYQFQSY